MQQVKKMALCIKNDGIKISFKRYGWRMVSVVVAYYLIRDLSIYVLIPYLVAQTL